MALSIPIFSIVLSVFLIPAVSINRNIKPLIINLSSIISLVVPAISETIAFSSFKSEFKRVDFPALGDHMMVTGIPFLMALPVLKESIRSLTSLSILNNKFFSLFLSANSTSSSEKSSSNSIRDAKSIN